MKRKLFLIGICFMLVLVVLPPLTSAKQARPIELSFSLFIPEQHLRYQNVWKPWIKMVEERTKGKVKITPYFASALAPLPENYDAIRKGIADIGEVLIYASPGRFPLTEVVMVPQLGSPSSLSGSRILMGLYNKFPEVRAEYPGVRVLWLDTSPTCRIETVKKPINTLEDLKGLKIRVTGVTAVETAKALGYTPVTMPMGDVYLALERGVLDGTAIPVEVLVSRKWAEVLKHVVGNTDLGHDAFAVVINIDTWKKLPLDVQKVINELSGQWASDFTGKEWDKFEVEAEKITKAKYGVKYTYLSKEELARWNKLLKPVKDKYAESLEAKGLPGRKVLEEALRLSEKYGK